MEVSSVSQGQAGGGDAACVSIELERRSSRGNGSWFMTGCVVQRDICFPSVTLHNIMHYK